MKKSTVIPPWVASYAAGPSSPTLTRRSITPQLRGYSTTINMIDVRMRSSESSRRDRSNVPSLVFDTAPTIFLVWSNQALKIENRSTIKLFTPKYGVQYTAVDSTNSSWGCVSQLFQTKYQVQSTPNFNFLRPRQLLITKSTQPLRGLLTVLQNLIFFLPSSPLHILFALRQIILGCKSPC